MAYEYKDPCARGYLRVKLSRADHHRLFPKRKATWKHRFEYYLSDTDFLIHRFASYRVVVLSLLLFPFSLIFYGLANYKEVLREHASLINPKKYGGFSADQVGSRSVSFPEIAKATKDFKRRFF
jgi:hypothetical protein